MESVQLRVESALDRLLPAASVAPVRLHQSMRYAALGGGKRVRPLLAFAAADVSGADPARVEVAASAVECIHAYSLVHDDLPCMDDDVLRRGRPTVHVEYDEATALLAGDSLQTLAFQLLSEHQLTEDSKDQLEMVRILAHASGSRGMAGGQAIDLAAVGRSLTQAELEFMHIHKTGAVIRAAVALGARCGGGRRLSEEELGELDRYAKFIGLAFQVIDDVLDCVTPTATLGKTAGKDAANNKPTYVSLLGLAQARTLAYELRDQAVSHLAGFGGRGRHLTELADFVVKREF
jgi:farnesyl diphosphate synthase